MSNKQLAVRLVEGRGEQNHAIVKHGIRLKESLVLSRPYGFNGTNFHAGDVLEIRCWSRAFVMLLRKSDGVLLRIPVRTAYQYLDSFSSPPADADIRDMVSKGYGTTPTGYRVEVDGNGPDGSPSWALVLGFV